jgi:hypothetical protein
LRSGSSLSHAIPAIEKAEREIGLPNTIAATFTGAAAEFRSLKPNRAWLEAIAKRTGGEVVALEDLEQFVRRLPERHAPITETWTDPLWHKPVVFLWVLGCFVAEWGIRRWKGLP